MLEPIFIKEVATVQTAALLKAKQLASLKPAHELLKYAARPDDDRVWREFLARFSPLQSPAGRLSYAALSELYAAYFLALCDAYEEPEMPVSSRSRTIEDSLDPADVPY